MDTLIQEFFNSSESVVILPTLMNFVLCIALAFVLKAFYIHRSFSLSGKQHLGAILPILSGVTFLVIIVVKSSLALSLGLVGALSIVRFRTPIKDPEELVYLFMAIALGLGYGAGQTVITTLLVTLLLAVIYWRLSNRSVRENKDYNLVLDWSEGGMSAAQVVDIVNEASNSAEIIKYSNDQGSQTLVVRLDIAEFSGVDQLTKRLQKEDPVFSVSFFESTALW